MHRPQRDGEVREEALVVAVGGDGAKDVGEGGRGRVCCERRVVRGAAWLLDAAFG